MAKKLRIFLMKYFIKFLQSRMYIRNQNMRFPKVLAIFENIVSNVLYNFIRIMRIIPFKTLHHPWNIFPFLVVLLTNENDLARDKMQTTKIPLSPYKTSISLSINHKKIFSWKQGNPSFITLLNSSSYKRTCALIKPILFNPPLRKHIFQKSFFIRI